MNVSLTPDVQQYIEDKVKAGQFQTADEAVNGLLSQFRQQEELTPQDIAELRAEIEQGLAEADRGEFVQATAEDVISERKAARKKAS